MGYTVKNDGDGHRLSALLLLFFKNSSKKTECYTSVIIENSIVGFFALIKASASLLLIQKQMVNYDNLTKEELFRRVADKDRAVFRYIYDKYSPAIHGIILQKTKCTKDAEEILIQTFVSFFNAQSSNYCRPISVFVVLHNIALNCIRKCNVFYLGHSSADSSYTNFFFKRKQQ
jgi:ABC-type Fe3+-siderophore transport system permease subunit